MSAIETALLAAIAHRTDIHQRWTQLIAQANATSSSTAANIPLASPQRIRAAALA